MAAPPMCLNVPQPMNKHRIDFPQFWVKEVGQTGTMARHNTQSAQKYCGDHSPFQSPGHEGYNFPCSTMATQMARHGMNNPKQEDSCVLLVPPPEIH